MIVPGTFEVRSLTERDIDFIADYWLNSDKDFLVSLGVDLNKIPSRKALTGMLINQIQLPDDEKSSLALIAELNNQAIGHCNVNNIHFGKEATMHLHLWNTKSRQKGLGTKMVLGSLPIFFESLKLERIWCEPYAKNQAPNRTLEKVGFEFVKKYVTIPGSLNFKQEVNRWKMTVERFKSIHKNSGKS